IQRIDPKLKSDDLKIAQSEFEPTFTADFNYLDETIRAASQLQGADTFNSKQVDLSGGISGKFITGTEYDIDFFNQRYQSDSRFQNINPYYKVEPQITITQPIFRDFGTTVNRAEIVIAQNNLKESQESFRDKVMAVITDTKAAYYKYVFQLEVYRIAKLALERAEKLLEINRVRYAKGILSSVNLLETEAAVLEKEKYLIFAEYDLKKAEDDLKLITNLVDDPELWNAKLELLDRPRFTFEEADLFDSLKSAFNFRPDYRIAKVDLENRDINTMLAKNALYPTLDLTGSFGLNGLGEDYSQAIDKTNFNYQDWSAGIKFSLPWGTGERAKYNQSKSEKAQALIAFKRLEENIILDIRDKVRKLKSQQQQVLAAKLSNDKEAQNYQAQKERYAAGYVSTHDLLDYQDKLAQAELDFVRAVIDYKIDHTNLEKAQGLTLVKNDIKLEQ
ncbi:MAG: TolC family protein, partial [Candidatus Omnitrophota bacterium]|nr:TolC family protein [Candidatus Omnitrophota bacterium]